MRDLAILTHIANADLLDVAILDGVSLDFLKKFDRVPQLALTVVIDRDVVDHDVAKVVTLSRHLLDSRYHRERLV